MPSIPMTETPMEHVPLASVIFQYTRPFLPLDHNGTAGAITILRSQAVGYPMRQSA